MRDAPRRGLLSAPSGLLSRTFASSCGYELVDGASHPHKSATSAIAAEYDGELTSTVIRAKQTNSFSHSPF